MAKFIILEGIDGSGKTKQSQLLQKRIQDCHVDCAIVRDPGGCKQSEVIRSILKNPKNKLTPIEQLELFALSKKMMYENVLKNFSHKAYVILDRFVASTFAYQKYAGNISDQDYQDYFVDICPDVFDIEQNAISIFIDVPVDVCLQRITHREEKDNFEDKKYLEKVYKGYHEYFDQQELFTKKYTVDGNRPCDVVNDEIFKLAYLEG